MLNLPPSNPSSKKPPIIQFDASVIESMRKDSFLIWAMYSGLRVDNKPVTFHDHPYMLPLYADTSKEIVLMKAAQLGATIWIILQLLWHCKYKDIKAVLYFPTKEGVEIISKDRITPIIDSNPEIKQMLDADDSLRLKRFGNSSLYLNYLGGSVSKDSTPLDVLAFDEVRLVDSKDIDQAQERVSHSIHKYKYFASTAGYPDMDIHRRFLNTNQQVFHTDCNCPDGVRLAHVFPNCVAQMANGSLHLECPKCKKVILEPWKGRFVVENPGKDVNGYHIHQLLSQYISLKEVWKAYNETTNVKEFYNAKLGLPWIDKENIPITTEILRKCVRTDIKWGEKGEGVAMGVDQMKGLNVVVIAKRVGKKKRIIHLEWIENANPFERIHQLMREYNVKMCVIDSLPNANEAYQFAKDHRPKAYLAVYTDTREMVQWMDRKTNKKIKTNRKHYSEDTQFQHKVLLDRYQSLDHTFKQFENGLVEIPDPRLLLTNLRNPATGRPESTMLCESVYFKHMVSVCREKVEQDEEIGKFKMKWKHLGIDPHFVHATNYCFFAIERMKPDFMFSFA